MNNPLIIGLTGHAYAGKDTATEYLRDALNLLHLMFAEPLIRTCAAAHNMTTEHWMAQNKEQTLQLSNRSYRQNMQAMGDTLRAGNPDFFTESMAQQITRSADYDSIFNGIVISDLRGDHEANWLRNQGGIVIHISRPQNQKARTGAHAHHTENPIILHKHDYTIDNSRDLHHLHQQLDTIAANIIQQHTQKAA